MEQKQKQGINPVDEKFVRVPSLTSAENRELLYDYVQKVRNRQLKQKLENVINSTSSIKKFRDILSRFSRDQERWFDYQDAAHTKILTEWLAVINIESSNTPEYSVSVGDRVRLDQAPFDEDLLAKILMTADFLVGHETKTFLSQILKGSKAKSVLGKKGETIPGYGAFAFMSIKDINDLIDRAIQAKWLKYENFNGSNPKDAVLAHSGKGWEKVKEMWSHKLFDELNNAAEKGTPETFIAITKGRHYEIRQNFLDSLFKKARRKHINVLKVWKNEETIKFKKRLQALINKLTSNSHSHSYSNSRKKPFRPRRRNK